MTKKITVISVLILSIILVSLYVVTSTYSVIINVIDNDGNSEIINDITIRDIFTNDNGEFNDIYYQVKNELDISLEEANILMESIPLNSALQRVLNSIVSYKLHNTGKFSNGELYDLLVDSVNEDDTISYELKAKVINKGRVYISDVSNYMYNIMVSSNGELV